MSARPRGVGRALVVAALVIVAVVLVGRAIDFKKDIWAKLTNPPAMKLPPVVSAALKAKPEPRTTLKNLSCFRCHNIGRYHKGKKFPHDTHKAEGLYHCHHCHLFEGHMAARIRKSVCGECHDDD